ncbi:MAG: DUF58 domain-containing protein [Candidatus Freyarchaeota archaeon]
MTAARSFISTALWFIVAGIIFSMPGLAYLSIIPMTVLALGLLIDPPGGISVERELTKTNLQVGEELRVKVRLKVRHGLGFVVIRDALPEEFALVDGSNVQAFFKGFRELVVEYEYVIKPAKRGKYCIGRSEVMGYHVFGLKPSRLGVFGKETHLSVLPRIRLPKRTRTPVTKSQIPIPVTNVSIRGVASTDFREIREYRAGDPVRFINWKASARKGEVMVNEFEKEGKKTVLFVIDATASEVGSSMENPLEYSIQLVSSLAYYFTKRNYNVGLYVAGHGKLILPAAGSKQLYILVKILLELEDIEVKKEDFVHAVESFKHVLIRYTPLVIYISNLLPGRLAEIREGIRMLRPIYRDKRLPMLVFDVSTYSLLEKGTGSLILLEKRALQHDLLRAGVYSILWDPTKEDVSSIVTKTVRLVR